MPALFTSASSLPSGEAGADFLDRRDGLAGVGQIDLDVVAFAHRARDIRGENGCREQLMTRQPRAAKVRTVA